MTHIAEIIDIPERVHQGDFVLKLTEGVGRAEATLRDYVVTPQLVDCFDQALSLIRSAVDTHSSKGAYLHGSFGSGKSHFMAVLSLLLQRNATARAIPDLAPVVDRHNAWTEGRRFLVVPYHLIGAVSLESAVLGQYAEYVRTLHPQAPTPGFYRAEKLFADAQRLRGQMGDALFFDKLGGRGGDGGGDGWGALDAAWDAYAFEAALAAEPGSEERARLVGDLVDTFFGAHRDLAGGREEGFVSLDEGLVILSRHARDLGYDAVVLFLDELILWLASHAADPPFVSREGQKVAKLVEATRMDRALPIVSFIARQRDLRELVGEHLPGAEQLGFADVLNWWQARFDEVTLEDRNLPAIVEKRLLRPRSDEAARTLAQAFEERTRGARDEVMNALLTREGDRAMFKQVYPFSPVLIQTLVAVSSLLQRERTALKLLLQLLVDQRDTLEVGDLVPVGDLYDVIESGDEPFTQAMKLRFDQARKLYRQKLVPLLEAEHGVAVEDVEAGRAPADRARAFRNDARLLKTLILSALADGVEALKGLTPARLAALNHGTVRTPIPGMEGHAVLTKIRGWAARVGEIKVSDDPRNPVVSLHLVGVDTEGVLENAKAFDNYGNRVQKVRALLHEMLGMPPEEPSAFPPRYRMTWKGTARECEVQFLNVREVPPDNFPPQDPVWRIIVDYPFDQSGYGPRDDVARVQEYFRQGRPPARTLVWIPAFLTLPALDELGRLVLLDHVLSGGRLDEYGAHLSQLDREQARIILGNQRDQVRQRVRNALLAAYGISNVGLDAVDTTHELDTHFYALDPGFTPQPPVGAGFRESLEHLFAQALQYQFPAHPDFEGEVTAARLRNLLEVVRQAAGSPDRRVEVERGRRDDVRRIAVPLGLGVMGEAHFVLGEGWVRDLEQKRARDGVAEVTVRRLREWINQPQARGLTPEAENLVIHAYALQTDRSFFLHGGPIPQPGLDGLQPEMELRAETLPPEEPWQAAVERAGAVLGVPVSPLRSAGNVARLIEGVQQAAGEKRDAVARYHQRLAEHAAALGVTAAAARLRTAEATHGLLAAISGARREAVVAAVAQAPVATSATAMSAAFRKAEELCGALERTTWDVLRGIEALAEPFGARGRAILAQLRQAVEHDEHVEPLRPALVRAQSDAVALLREAAGASTSTSPGTRTDTPPVNGPRADERQPRGARVTYSTARVRSAEVERALAEVREQARRAPDAWVELEWRIVEAEDDGRGAAEEGGVA